jgi:hypothetical protein
MLQSVAYVAGIRNVYSPDMAAPRGPAGGRRLTPSRCSNRRFRVAAARFNRRTIGADQAMTANELSLVWSFCLQISPTVEFESRQARCDEGEIICPGNQKTEIEQSKPRLPWVLRRHGDCPLATIDHGRPEAAVGSTAPGFGSDVIRANDQVQARFRHINPQICDRRSPGYRLDNCDEMFAFGETSG